MAQLAWSYTGFRFREALKEFHAFMDELMPRVGGVPFRQRMKVVFAELKRQGRVMDVKFSRVVEVLDEPEREGVEPSMVRAVKAWKSDTYEKTGLVKLDLDLDLTK